MLINFNLTEQSEIALKTIKQIGVINDIDVSTKAKQINLAIKIAKDCMLNLDEESTQQILNLKKSI